jgi:hypothetical protein
MLDVIQDRASHQLHGFLSSMTGSGLEPIAPKGVQVGHLPHRGLRALPVGFTPVPNTDPAGFVLPMIMAAAEREMLLDPNNLGADLEVRRQEPPRDFDRMHPACHTYTTSPANN